MQLYQIGEGMPVETELCDLLDFSGPNAGGAYAQAPSSSVHERTNRLQVQIPTTLGHVMSVTDAVAELGSAAANIAYFRHKTGFSRRGKE